MSDSSTKLFSPLHETIATRPAPAEEQVLELWKTEDTFRALERERQGAPAFVFWEGPPTANGKPGIHHVFARTIKDTVCRYQTMLGKRVTRKAGWDTHGLPVELGVEKQLGISGKPQIEAYGVAEFNARCRQSVWEYKQDWEALSQRIGYWLDYSSPYITYDDQYVESVWYLLARFHQAGYAYRGKRVLPYCGRCGTGLSSHELGQPGVYRDVPDPSILVRFRLVDDPRSASLLAWTTTPWTLPSNIALAVHPTMSYVLARVALPVPKGAEKGSAGTECLWIAKARAQAVLGEHEVLEERLGSELVGWRYQRLFEDPIVLVEPGAWTPDPAGLERVYSAEYVSMDDGTGIVHQAAAYGVDDWEVARAQRLPVRQAVGSEGRFLNAVAGVAAGTFFKDADEPLMEDLKRRGLLFRKARDPHSYPHCWRCDTPLFYFAAPAWYLRTTALKERMIELNRAVRWVPPEIGSGRFGEWLENNIDWNISRDRYWGTPLPFWVCDACEQEEAIGSRADLAARAGALPANFDFHKPSIDEPTWACKRCSSGTMRRTKSVLDCWFDSGAMPYAQWHWPFGPGKAQTQDQFPADFIAEGLDQTRGWFYTLHAIGTFVQSLPDSGLPAGPIYRTCVVNGLVLDKDGVKMSKRLGNIVDPWAAVGEHGADAVRWYLLASGATWLPKRFDPAGILEVRRRLVGTLVNSYKFFADYARLADGYDPSQDRALPPPQRPEIDRWLVSRTQSLVRDVRKALDAYDLSGCAEAIERFTSDDLSNWYIRRNRKRFHRTGKNADKTAAFATLHEALRSLSLLIAPMMPFLAEMLWRRLVDPQSSVHAQAFPASVDAWVDTDLEESMRMVARVVEMGRALRERASIKIRQPLARIHLRASHAHAVELLQRDFAREQILGELNIRDYGSVALDDGQLCVLKAKANFRTLGKRLGAKMKAAAAAIETLSSSEVARLRAGSSVSLDVAGETLSIGPTEVDVLVETRADFDLETDGRLVVYLDTALDDDLRAEGLYREAVSRINALRKERGYSVEDRIQLVLDARGHGLLTRSLAQHGSNLAEETLAASSLHTDTRGAPDAVALELDQDCVLYVRVAKL